MARCPTEIVADVLAAALPAEPLSTFPATLPATIPAATAPKSPVAFPISLTGVPSTPSHDLPDLPTNTAARGVETTGAAPSSFPRTGASLSSTDTRRALGAAAAPGPEIDGLPTPEPDTAGRPRLRPEMAESRIAGLPLPWPGLVWPARPGIAGSARPEVA
eukprot:scaffold28534_cov90-Isochrysis_galbana.AAC.2